MKQYKRFFTMACLSVGMLGMVAMASEAQAKCTVTLKIVNAHSKTMSVKEAHVKYKKGGGNWIGIRRGTKTRKIDAGKSLSITFTHIPDCKRKKKIKLKFFTKTVNNTKVFDTKSWEKGKRLTLTWKGERTFTYSGS